VPTRFRAVLHRSRTAAHSEVALSGMVLPRPGKTDGGTLVLAAILGSLHQRGDREERRMAARRVAA
jgi:hypothetical protein